MFANMRLNFQGDHMPLLGTMLPPPQAAIAGESSGEDAPSHPPTIPVTITEPDHSHDHAALDPSSLLPCSPTFLIMANHLSINCGHLIKLWTPEDCQSVIPLM
ncbi:hypothetical protein Tco_0459986 [Tanacetum coccineum]